MASKNTKKAIAQTLETMPVNPLTMTFVSVVNPKLIESNTEIEGVKAVELPKEVLSTITITKLKGFEYGEEFKKLMDEFKHKEFYIGKEVLIVSRGGNVVRTTMRTLTNSISLHTFMLGNADKLYLQAHEQKFGSVIDRNYAEICGMLQQNTENIHKAYVSKGMTKSIKADIKDLATARAIMDNESYSNSPLRSLKNQVLQIVSADKIANYQKQVQEARKASKQLIGYKK